MMRTKIKYIKPNIEISDTHVIRIYDVDDYELGV